MSHTRNTGDWQSATIVLDKASINEGIRNIAIQIKQTLGHSFTPPVVHLIDTDPNTPALSTKLAEKLFHESKKQTSNNFMIDTIEGYVQFDEQNEPIITKHSFHNMIGSTVIIVSIVPNEVQLKKLLPLLAKACVKTVLLASLIKTSDANIEPNFYAFDCNLLAQELMGYGMPGLTSLKIKSEVRTASHECRITAHDQVNQTPLLSQETTRPDAITMQLQAAQTRLKTTVPLRAKEAVKSAMDKMIQTQLIPFLEELAKDKKPIAFFIMKNGATHFAAYVLSKLGEHENLPDFSVHSLHGSRYGSNHVGGEMVWYIKPPAKDFSNSYVFLLEDILEGGKTMDFTMQKINAPLEHQFIVALGDKPLMRLPDCKHIQPKFKVYDFDKEFIVGGGLDEDHMRRADWHLTMFPQANDKIPKAEPAPQINHAQQKKF